jgi:hypothetical protein
MAVPKWAKILRRVRSQAFWNDKRKCVVPIATYRLCKCLVMGFPDAPLVTLWEEGWLGLEERMEKVAPVSRRKLIALPSTVRVTRGIWVQMTVCVGAGSEGPRAHQSCCWTI